MWRLSLALLVFLASAAPGTAGVLDPQPDFDEFGPEAAVHPNGDVLLVWTRSSPVLFEPVAMAATLDPDTGELGELHEWGIGFAAKVVPLGSGFLALRVYGPHLDTYPEAFVQRMDGGGRPIGTELTLGPVFSLVEAQPTPDGGAFVVAVSIVGTGSAAQNIVHAWRFSADGALLSGPAQLAGDSIQAVFGVDAAGNLVLAWRNQRGRVFARRFSPGLQPLTPVLPVASGVAFAVLAVVAPDGRFVVVYRKAPSDLWAHAYRADGSSTGKASSFSSLANNLYMGDLDVAIGAQGRILVVWPAYARVLSLAGRPLSRVLRLARGGVQHPRVERLPEGGFLVLWTQAGANGSLRFRRMSGR